MGPGAILCGLTPRTDASYFHKLVPRSHVRATKPWTTALCCTHGAGDRGVKLLCLEPRRVALQKRLFRTAQRRRPRRQASLLGTTACGVTKKRLFREIFSRTGYFVLKFTIRVNFIKIVPIHVHGRTHSHACTAHAAAQQQPVKPGPSCQQSTARSTITGKGDDRRRIRAEPRRQVPPRPRSNSRAPGKGTAEQGRDVEQRKRLPAF
jgi:hypothetical protein